MSVEIFYNDGCTEWRMVPLGDGSQVVMVRRAWAIAPAEGAGPSYLSGRPFAVYTAWVWASRNLRTGEWSHAQRVEVPNVPGRWWGQLGTEQLYLGPDGVRAEDEARAEGSRRAQGYIHTAYPETAAREAVNGEIWIEYGPLPLACPYVDAATDEVRPSQSQAGAWVVCRHFESGAPALYLAPNGQWGYRVIYYSTRQAAEAALRAATHGIGEAHEEGGHRVPLPSPGR